MTDCEPRLAAARSEQRRHKVHFNSRFAHLNIHNGFRPGELHTFIAEKGGGKSTLVRAWVLELLAQGKRVYIRLSEEYPQAYRDEIAARFTPDTAHLLKNLVIDSELELPPEEMGSRYVDALNARIIRADAQIFLLDNFTTSDLSRATPRGQEESTVKLRRLAHDADIPVLIVAHTEKGFTKKRGVATGDNIRGNMTLSNTAAYIYTLTVFFELPGQPAVLFIDKARHHTEANKKLFMLRYDHQHRSYVSDHPAAADEIKKIFKELSK